MKIRFAALALLALAPVQAAAETAKPGQPTPLQGSFGFTGEHEQRDRRSASGIACLGPQNCLVAFDEGRSARRAKLSPSGYLAGAAVKLPIEGDEGDAEAVAAAGGRFFVTGSHSVKRKTRPDGSCEPNDASRFVARIEPDGRVIPGNILPAIAAVPTLNSALGRCLKDGEGLDIEGLAATRDHLWFGFRGPPAPIADAGADDGGAYVLRVDAAAAFDGGDLHPELLVANVGEGRVIRDMQAVGDQLLLLAGPPKGVDDRAGYALVLFDPRRPRETKTLKVLDFSKIERRTFDGCEDEKRLKDVKPEGLMVADPAADPLRVAILSDGLCDGGPVWFDIER